MQVRSVGYRNGGVPQIHTMDEGSTVADLYAILSITSPRGTAVMVNGSSADTSTALNEGDTVQYTQVNLKGA